MSLNEEEIKHDNDSYCFENHTCIDCEYEKINHDKDPCVICIGISNNDRICKWKPKSEK